jgi:serine protease Do
MHPRFRSLLHRGLSFWFCLGVASVLILTAAPVRGADGSAAAKPPFQFQVDAAPLDRTAPLTGSYAPVLRRPALAVGSLFATRRGNRSAGSPGASASSRSSGGAPDAARGNGSRRTRIGLGSCFLLTGDGYLLTTNHGLEGFEDIKVRLGSPARDYAATLVGRDPTSDLAVLKIDASGQTAAILGDSDQLQAGDLVLALGDATGQGPVISHGIISALGRPNPAGGGADDLIQTDDPIAPGISGGPLLDARGRVVGVNTVSDGSSSGVLGLAIPINLARAVALQLVASGRVQRGYLGVTLQDLTDDLKAQFGAAQGALVSEVTPEGPASRAGLKGGDVIVRAEGLAVADPRGLQRVVGRLQPGRDVALEVVRNGQSRVLHVKLGMRPGESPVALTDDKAGGDGVLDGVTVADVDADVRSALRLPAGLTGAVITEVAPNSASAAAGLRAGDVITELDRRPVASADEAVRLSALLKGPKVMVRLWRGGGSHYVVVDESAK